VAVIGVPHKTYGEEVKAFIVPKEDSTTNSKAFVAWGRERLADFKYPRQVEVVSELPMTATGKILKRLLK
jgi:long-chain acyl-CoA synthetase